MLDAVLGIVIVVVATTSLVLAVEVAESSISSAGQQPLDPSEQEMLQLVRRGDPDSLRDLELDLKVMPRDLSEQRELEQ